MRHKVTFYVEAETTREAAHYVMQLLNDAKASAEVISDITTHAPPSPILDFVNVQRV